MSTRTLKETSKVQNQGVNLSCLSVYEKARDYVILIFEESIVYICLRDLITINARVTRTSERQAKVVVKQAL